MSETNAARAADILTRLKTQWGYIDAELQQAIAAEIDAAEARGRREAGETVAAEAHDWLIGKCGDESCACRHAVDLYEYLETRFFPEPLTIAHDTRPNGAPDNA